MSRLKFACLAASLSAFVVANPATSTTDTAPQTRAETNSLRVTATGEARYYGPQTSELLRDVEWIDLYAASDLDCDAAGRHCQAVNRPSDAPQICFLGDIQQVCSTLSQLSENDRADYQDGNHELSSLTACEVEDGQVYAEFLLVHDYVRYEVKSSQFIQPCTL